MRNLLLALVVLIITACGEASSPSVAEMTPAQKLVALDTHGTLPKKDEGMVLGYQAILDNLAAKYPGTSTYDLADLSVRGQGALQKSGIRVYIYDIIEGLEEATPAGGINGLSYKDAVATYATLRVKGMDQDSAVKGLAQFLARTKAMKP